MAKLPKVSKLPKGSMARRIVWRVTILVGVVTIMLSTFSAVASFQILSQHLDDRLRSAANQGFSRGSFNESTTCADFGAGLVRVEVNLISLQYMPISCPFKLTDAGLQQLFNTVVGAPIETINLQGEGYYRVMASSRNEVEFSVVALPLSEVTNPLAWQLIALSLFTLLAIGATYLLTRRVVTHAMNPLHRLTYTAAHVSQMPLASSEETVSVRFNPTGVAPESEVGRVGSAFNHMLDNIDRALAARHESETKVRQFVADASHELRNPLASIRGYAELTKRNRDELPEETAYALSRIESEANRMSALVDDLLLLARLDSGPVLEFEPTDVTEIVLNALSDARVAGPDHNWILDVPDAPLIVPGNAFQLHQVVANLLANARTHTPAGTTVKAELVDEAAWVRITVADNGPGVPEEVRPTIFERFSRADSSRTRMEGVKSTGLGLAIVAAVVEAHHGYVALSSKPGTTLFTVRLPKTQ